jgi:parvulin-like peptidyl-prolyl isomerase
MNRFFVGLAVLGLGAAGAVAPARAEVVDAVAATVGAEVILMSEVMENVAPLAQQLRQEATSEAAFDTEIRRAVADSLDQAIESKILYRQAQLAGMQVEDFMVEQRLDEVKKRYPSEAAFQDVLRESGESMSDVRVRLRQQIMAVSMGFQKRRELEKQVAISEADVQQYYRDHLDEFQRKERVLLRRIFLNATSDEERARARARLAALKEELDLGASFGELAKRYSDGPEAEEGGRVGWVERGDLVVALEDAAFGLQAGQTSAIIDTEFGCVLLSIEDREEAGVATLDEVRTEIEPILRAKGADENYKAWMAELRQRSRVRVFL